MQSSSMQDLGMQKLNLLQSRNTKIKSQVCKHLSMSY